MGRVLTGRHITFGAAPFSFREYLRKRGWEDFTPEYLAHNKDKLLHYLSAFLETGGFPETVELDDFGRKQVLTALYNDILARDISSRYGASFEITELIQVAWDVRDETTRRREERALWCAMEELDVGSGIILNEDEERTLEKNGKTIRYLQIWKWLLVKDIPSKEPL